ncbi:MAG TPA: ATP-dependent helicase [Planctomycetaceae bacterium]|nr:ATP-dependent helicase [Planctomycetaceae bacterium]
MVAFDRLHPALQHHIVNSLGWRELREVQSLSIEAYLNGNNMVVLAPTAGGKTESAFFPVMSQMLEESWEGVSVLYVSPIKALLNNQEQRLHKYMQLVGRRAALWHGDTPQGERKRILAEPPDLLLTTPESLEVMLVSSKIDHHRFFKNIRAVVIDEVHAFAGDDRGWHLLSVFARIAQIAKCDLQRIGLSATVGNPEEMLTWLASGSQRPQKVVWPKGKGGEEPDVQLDFVGSLGNAAKVISLLHQGEKRLVFCDSRSRVEQLAVALRSYGVDTFVSHSSLGIDERRQAEEAFSQRQNCVIVSTSSLELGLDVGDLDRVIQIDAPSTVSSFLQRMGRTGRRQNTTRNYLFLATKDEGLLRAAALIELWLGGYVEPVQAPPCPYHILAQQLMALILQERGVGRSQWFSWVSSVPAFSRMPEERVASLVEYMISKLLLWDDSGILSFAPEGEATFGRQNFMDLLSVFTSPPLFRVMSGQKELGYVHESTFYKKDDDGPPILALAGRSWKTSHLDWKRKIAHVEPTDQRGKSRWLGEGQMLNQAVCQSIRRILSSDDNHKSWSNRASAQFAEIRDEFPWISSDATSLVLQPNGEIRWWTFAGGVANTLLADALKPSIDVKGDNLSLVFPKANSLDEVSPLIMELNADNIRPIPNIEAMENLKFSECLSGEHSMEVFSSRFDDPSALRQSIEERRRETICG